jgi:ABC-type Fe3+/spermidine/putrescine transport system ATPase subunit
MTSAGFLDVDRVTAGYGGLAVLKEVSLSVDEGQFVALLGSSGCGKTTLLRAIAGFVQPWSGEIRAAGRNVTRLPPDRRDMALVFQSYALWPHMSVRQNIGYGLRLRRIPREAIAAKVDGILAMLGLAGLGERNVTRLSGGQRQRVALGRALAVDPRILLLDEPLSNLDARIRQSVRHEIRALQRRLGITAIHVTHDREEAMVMADRIVILNAGQIEQEGAPEAVYNAPATPFVARFMGAENAVPLSAKAIDGRLEVAPSAENAAATLPLPPRLAGEAGGGSLPLTAFFRSEAAELSAAGADAPDRTLALVGRVKAASYPGGAWRHAVAVGDREVQVDSTIRHAPGSDVHILLPAAATFLFRSEGTEFSGPGEAEPGIGAPTRAAALH